MELSRRTFLKGIGATGGIAALDSQMPAIAAAAEAAKKKAPAAANALEESSSAEFHGDPLSK